VDSRVPERFRSGPEMGDPLTPTVGHSTMFMSEH
jgi:hypothetical protein